MAHFAILKTGNIVERVEVVHNSIATSEQIGVKFLQTLYNNQHLPVVQTSKDGSIRKNGAGIGYTYDQTRDAFIPPKPYASWILNETTCLWEAPSAMPDDGEKYTWNESTTNWDIVE